MAITFDGSTEYYKASSISVPAAWPVTLSCWFVDDLGTNDSDGTLLGFMEDGGAGTSFALVKTRGDDSSERHCMIALRDTGTPAPLVFTTVDVMQNGWHHVAAVFAGNTSRTIYVDNQASAEQTTPSVVLPSAVDVLSIGTFVYSGTIDFHGGEISECAVWEAELTTDEISALAAGYSPRFIRPDKLVFYHPLWTTSPGPDWYGGATLTENGTPVDAAHPPMIYPSAPQLVFGTAAAAGAGIIPHAMNSYRRRRVG